MSIETKENLNYLALQSKLDGLLEEILSFSDEKTDFFFHILKYLTVKTQEIEDHLITLLEEALDATYNKDMQRYIDVMKLKNNIRSYIRKILYQLQDIQSFYYNESIEFKKLERIISNSQHSQNIRV